MFTTVLVALKYTPSGLNALRMAVRLCREQSGRLLIFHALDYRLKGLAPEAPECVQACTDAQVQFEDAAVPEMDGFADYDFICAPAEPALEICRLARSRSVDLIVLGAHQHPERMSLGRVDLTGMTILEKSPCPILLVPFVD